MDDKFKPFRLSPITRTIEEYLFEKVSVGQVVSYEEIGSLAGVKMECDPKGDGYRYLISAIKRLERRACNFVNVKEVGYRKLDYNECVEDNIKRNKLSRRQVQRTLKRNEALPYRELGVIARLEWQASIMVGKVVNKALSERAKTKLIEEIQKAPDRKEIDYDRLSEIYLKGKNPGTIPGVES